MLLVGIGLAGVLWMNPPVPVELKIVSAAFLVSSAIEYLRHGRIGVLPASCAVRVGTILVTAAAVTHSILTRWPGRPAVVLGLSITLLLAQAAIGWAILVMFPDSIRLWAARSRVGLGFPGDPHQHRLLGPVLDPNYFGLVLGPALTAGMVLGQRALWVAVACADFIASPLMTVSRSSALGFVVWAPAFIGLRALRGERFSRSWRHWAGLGNVTLAVMLLMNQTVARLAWRVSTTLSAAGNEVGPALPREPSAAHRLGGLAEVAAQLANSRVLACGLGYNFLSLVSWSKYLITVYNSSLGNPLITLGLPLSLVVWALVRWVQRAYSATLGMDPTLADALLAYLIAAVAMSFFNNLAFYTPFLFSVAVILSVFHFAREGVETPGRAGRRAVRQVFRG